MRRVLLIVSLLSCFISCQENQNQQPLHPLQNRAPLAPKAFLELPLGTVKPQGWLLQQLKIMKSGMTGHLDEWYPSVIGERNGWLGGDGDGWERGPYWLDGLVPLAWILDDEELKAKARPWIEWTLNSQTDSGYFGPVPFPVEPEPEAGIQKSRRRDWWPKMVMLKVLQQYHEATGDERVIDLMTGYFRYQLNELPETPLDHWSFWANRRGGDNLMLVYWLYNKTGDSLLLELADLIHEQTFPWAKVFINEDCYSGADLDHLYPYNTVNRYPFDQELIDRLCLKQLQSFHCVNLAQGIKAPVIRYQQDRNPLYLQAVKKAFADIQKYHGQPQGMYGGDEPMHGKNPTQGIELCSVVEMMYSLEKMIAISGDPEFMDQLELIAYNALPAQITEDFASRQYFQQANQVMLTRHRHNFYEEDHHGHTDLCFGLLTGYPCCTCNLHQGWPKLVSHLWYATPDGGVASILYAPSTMSFVFGKGQGDGESKKVSILEETAYPFDDQIHFKISAPGPVQFPFHLRIPGWCENPSISINGEAIEIKISKGMVVVDRTWKEGDQVRLHLPMEVRLSRWVENAVSVARGPLLYVLGVEEKWEDVKSEDRWGDFSEVRPAGPWNYGLLESAIQDPDGGFIFHQKENFEAYPWSFSNTPVRLRTRGKLIPDWVLYREMAGPLPHSLPLKHLEQEPAEELVLIPYGCSKLRITEFPVVR